MRKLNSRFHSFVIKYNKNSTDNMTIKIITIKMFLTWFFHLQYRRLPLCVCRQKCQRLYISSLPPVDQPVVLVIIVFDIISLKEPGNGKALKTAVIIVKTRITFLKCHSDVKDWSPDNKRMTENDKAIKSQIRALNWPQSVPCAVLDLKV